MTAFTPFTKDEFLASADLNAALAAVEAVADAAATAATAASTAATSAASDAAAALTSAQGAASQAASALSQVGSAGDLASTANGVANQALNKTEFQQTAINNINAQLSGGTGLRAWAVIDQRSYRPGGPVLLAGQGMSFTCLSTGWIELTLTNPASTADYAVFACGQFDPGDPPGSTRDDMTLAIVAEPMLAGYARTPSQFQLRCGYQGLAAGTGGEAGFDLRILSIGVYY